MEIPGVRRTRHKQLVEEGATQTKILVSLLADEHWVWATESDEAS